MQLFDYIFILKKVNFQKSKWNEREHFKVIFKIVCHTISYK